MFPLVGIPKAIASALASYRQVLCREAGFEHICRYISGLFLSPNKTLQGIYNQVVWPPAQRVSRRAMHESIFASGWQTETLMQPYRNLP